MQLPESAECPENRYPPLKRRGRTMDPCILIVDDNDDNRFTLSLRLETCGYSNLVTAEDGRDALKKMRSGLIDLVLLDIMMPELDGWWAEAYEPGLGWAIGDGREHGSDPAWDRQALSE